MCRGSCKASLWGFATHLDMGEPGRDYAVVLRIGQGSENGFLSENVTVLNDALLVFKVSARICWEMVTFLLVTC